MLLRLYDGYAALSSISTTNNVAVIGGFRNAQGLFDGKSDEFMTVSIMKTFLFSYMSYFSSFFDLLHLKDFNDFSNEKHSKAIKFYMYSYLEERLMSRSSNIDILSYWRTREVWYLVVAKMIKDILVILISTVAFSTGERVLDCYRSSLKPNIVETIICLRDGVFGDAKLEPQMEELCDHTMSLKVEEADDTPCPSPTPSPDVRSPQLFSTLFPYAN